MIVTTRVFEVEKAYEILLDNIYMQGGVPIYRIGNEDVAFPYHVRLAPFGEGGDHELCSARWRFLGPDWWACEVCGDLCYLPLVALP